MRLMSPRLRQNSVWRLPPLTKLEKYLQNNPPETPYLLFEGRIPSFAILHRLQQILFAIPLESSLVLSQDQLRSLISQFAGDDFRTHRKYIICIRTFIISKNPGKQWGYYSTFDLTGLQDSIIECMKIQKQRLREHDQSLPARRRLLNSKRIWCRECHKFKSITGVCKC